jgi:polysaccharide chain length determinant protein (PEP-CTERM system associated)
MGRPVPEIIHLLLAAGWRRRFLICVPLLLLPPIGLLVGMFGAKTYEARMTVLVQEPAKLNPFLEDLAIGTKLMERMPVLSSLAHSQHTMGEVAADLGLLGPSTPKAERDALTGKLSNNLSINLIGEDLIDMRLRGASPEHLHEILSRIGQRFIDKLVAPERSSLAGSVQFLQQQIAARRASLTEAEERLARFKEESADRLPELAAANLERLAKLRDLLEERRTDLAGAVAAVADLRVTLGATNPVVGSLEKDIVRLSGQLALLRARYTDEHSAVQATVMQLRRLEEERARTIALTNSIVEKSNVDQLWALSVGNKSEKDDAPPLLLSQFEQLRSAKRRESALRKEVAQLEKSVNDLQDAVSGQTKVELELTRLERDIGTAREIYGTLVKRFEMARVTGDLGSFEAAERVQIIDDPDEATPVGPPAALFVVAGVIGGLVLGIGLAFAAEIGNETVRRRADLERIPNLRLIARIPNIPAEQRALASAAVGPLLSTIAGRP